MVEPNRRAESDTPRQEAVEERERERRPEAVEGGGFTISSYCITLHCIALDGG